MILSQREIKSRLALSVENRRSLVITPLLQETEAFSTDSVDLRLGTHFLLPPIPPPPFADLSSTQSGSSYMKVHVPLGKHLVIQAHQTVLGATLEFIKLPYDTAGQILTKSSIARTFVVIETAPWIHPSYRGCLTLEIANVSNTPLLLRPGIPIGQLILMSVTDPVEELKLGGRYLGPVYPETPPPLNTNKILDSIGVPPQSVESPPGAP
jgi:dCTP deaminase